MEERGSYLKPFGNGEKIRTTEEYEAKFGRCMYGHALVPTADTETDWSVLTIMVVESQTGENAIREYDGQAVLVMRNDVREHQATIN